MSTDEVTHDVTNPFEQVARQDDLLLVPLTLPQKRNSDHNLPLYDAYDTPYFATVESPTKRFCPDQNG